MGDLKAWVAVQCDIAKTVVRYDLHQSAGRISDDAWGARLISGNTIASATTLQGEQPSAIVVVGGEYPRRVTCVADQQGIVRVTIEVLGRTRGIGAAHSSP